MTSWEYGSANLATTPPEKLDSLGREGWEGFAVWGDLLLLKRPVGPSNFAAEIVARQEVNAMHRGFLETLAG